jgi:hypothetical protein
VVVLVALISAVHVGVGALRQGRPAPPECDVGHGSGHRGRDPSNAPFLCGHNLGLDARGAFSCPSTSAFGPFWGAEWAARSRRSEASSANGPLDPQNTPRERRDPLQRTADRGFVRAHQPAHEALGHVAAVDDEQQDQVLGQAAHGVGPASLGLAGLGPFPGRM